jgi:hypothetical protein
MRVLTTARPLYSGFNQRCSPVGRSSVVLPGGFKSFATLHMAVGIASGSADMIMARSSIGISCHVRAALVLKNEFDRLTCLCWISLRGKIVMKT